MNGRGTASKESEKFYNITIQPEKEVIMILVAVEIKDKIGTLDFSKDILNVSNELEERMIEAINNTGTTLNTNKVNCTLCKNINTIVTIIVNIFLTKFIINVVYISFNVFVSLVTLVTSFPTGISFSWSTDKLSIALNTSSLILYITFCPIFCNIKDCTN